MATAKTTLGVRAGLSLTYSLFRAIKPLQIAPENAGNRISEALKLKKFRGACPRSPLGSTAFGGRLSHPPSSNSGSAPASYCLFMYVSPRKGGNLLHKNKKWSMHGIKKNNFLKNVKFRFKLTALWLRFPQAKHIYFPKVWYQLIKTFKVVVLWDKYLILTYSLSAVIFNYRYQTN